MALNPVHLRTLYEIARLQSFSRAAEALRLSQPAVSLHVRQLEEALGLPLLERLGKRAATTPAGALLLERGGRALEALEAAAASIHALRGVVAGRVRVPGLVLFLGLGMLVGSDGLGWIAFNDYELARDIGIIALVLILFEGGLTSGYAGLRPVLGGALSLATVGTVMTPSTPG